MIGRIGHVSHHLGSLLGAIGLTDFWVFMCKVGYFDAQFGRLYYTKTRFDLLASLRKCNYLFYME